MEFSPIRDVRDAKSDIRGRILALRLALTEGELSERSARIAGRALSLEPFEAAARVALYSPIRNEVLTAVLHDEAVSRGKEVYYPRVVRGRGSLEFRRVRDLSELEPGAFGIPEPPPGEPSREGKPDLFFLPGVAFGPGGERLGYGSGYYDRSLAEECRGAARVGLAFDFQVVAGIPSCESDARVDWVITDERAIRTAPERAAGAPERIPRAPDGKKNQRRRRT